MRRQVGHITSFGYPGVLKPAIAAGVILLAAGVPMAGACCCGCITMSGVTAEGMVFVLNCGAW